jgi:DNA-binding response OmpR family regulator
MDGKNVLLVDDSDIVLGVGKLLLEAAGFAVRTAQDLRQLDAVLTSWSPDLVLTDVNMPELNGQELCRRIKAQVAREDVPLVLMSSLGDTELALLAKRCGADAWLSKDQGLERLPERVLALCEGGPS